MIQGAIFDLDGTVIDSMPYWRKLGGLYLEKYGKKASPDLSDVLSTMTTEEGVHYLKESYRIPIPETQMLRDIYQMIDVFYFYHAPIKSGIIPFLEWMKKSGIHMIIATETNISCAQTALERNRIDHYFDDIITTEHVGSGKKKSSIYLAACKKIKTIPSETIVFEDAPHAAKTARDAGFMTVGIYDSESFHSSEELKKSCDYFLHSYHNISAFLTDFFDKQ